MSRMRRTMDCVGTRLIDLPASLAEVVANARVAYQQGERPRPQPATVTIDDELRSWVRDYVASGDLDAAIAHIASDDPDLEG